MEKELYNTILLVGPDIILDLETIKLFEKNQANGWVIIGETQDSIDHNISLPIVERKLENKIAPNAKIFISAHGLQTGLENKEHTVQLQGKDSINTKEYFTQLSELNSNKPLHINLLSCHGAAANKNISALAAGSTLITYVDSKYPSWTKLLNYAEEKILERLSNDPSITPAQQFIRSLTENFQGMAFSSKDQNGNTKTFKTTRFLKDENIKDLLFLLKKKEGRTARELILDELEYNKEMFCKEFPEYKKEVQNIEFNLDDNQIKDLITGKILHLFLKNFKEQNKDVNNFEQKINKIQQEIAKETDSKKKNKFKARKFELERDFYISLKETQTNLKELIQILKKDNNFDLYHSINGLNIAQMRYNDQAKLNPIYS